MLLGGGNWDLEGPEGTAGRAQGKEHAGSGFGRNPGVGLRLASKWNKALRGLGGAVQLWICHLGTSQGGSCWKGDNLRLTLGGDKSPSFGQSAREVGTKGGQATPEVR